MCWAHFTETQKLGTSKHVNLQNNGLDMLAYQLTNSETKAAKLLAVGYYTFILELGDNRIEDKLLTNEYSS